MGNNPENSTIKQSSGGASHGSGKSKDNGSGLLGFLKGKRSAVLLVVAAAAGVLLLIIGSMDTGSPEGGTNTAGGASNTPQIEEIAAALEDKVARLCEGAAGISDVSVLITLDCGYEYVYAQNTTGGSVSQGGVSSGGRSDYLTVGGSGSQNTVLIKEIAPRVRGIAIVCRGGGDPENQNRIIKLLSAAFGISSNRIYIAERG